MICINLHNFSCRKIQLHQKLTQVTFQLILMISFSCDTFSFFMPHHWLSSSAMKAGRREVPDSISNRTCRPNRSEFSVVFSENCLVTTQDPLVSPPQRALHLQASVPSETMWALTPSPTNFSAHSRITFEQCTNICKI